MPNILFDPIREPQASAGPSCPSARPHRVQRGERRHQYGRATGTMDPTNFHTGPSRLLRASQGSDEETRQAAYRSYPLTTTNEENRPHRDIPVNRGSNSRGTL